MELTKDESLAFYEALNKWLNDKKKGVLTEAKAEARNELLGMFNENGVNRRALMCGNVQVGEIGVSFSKPRPYIFGERMEEALGFLLENGLAEIKPKTGWEDAFKRLPDGSIILAETGEFVDWLGWDDGGAKTATVRGCKPEDVLGALAPKLAGSNFTTFLIEEVN